MEEVVGRVVLLAGVLELVLKNLEELAVLALADVWAPGVSQLEESILELLLCELIKILWWSLLLLFFLLHGWLALTILSISLLVHG